MKLWSFKITLNKCLDFSLNRKVLEKNWSTSEYSGGRGHRSHDVPLHCVNMRGRTHDFFSPVIAQLIPGQYDYSYFIKQLILVQYDYSYFICVNIQVFILSSTEQFSQWLLFYLTFWKNNQLLALSFLDWATIVKNLPHYQGVEVHKLRILTSVYSRFHAKHELKTVGGQYDHRCFPIFKAFPWQKLYNNKKTKYVLLQLPFLLTVATLAYPKLKQKKSYFLSSTKS